MNKIFVALLFKFINTVSFTSESKLHERLFAEVCGIDTRLTCAIPVSLKSFVPKTNFVATLNTPNYPDTIASGMCYTRCCLTSLSI